MRSIQIRKSSNPTSDIIIEALVPDYHMWLNDNNVIELDIVDGVLPMIIKIDFEYTLRILNPTPPPIYRNVAIRSNQMQYTATSNGNKKILFDLNNNIQDIAAYMIWALGEDINIKISFQYTDQGNTYMNSETFSCKLGKGKSFLTKPHGSSSVIPIYNDSELTNVQIWAPFSSDAVIENSSFSNLDGYSELNLSSIITTPGEYSLCLSPANADEILPVVTMITDQYLTPYSSDIIFTAEEPPVGEHYPSSIWDRCEKDTKCYTIIYEEPCCDFPFAELKYRDTDGCIRYIGGKILNEVDSRSGKSYPYYNNHIMYVNSFFTQENSKTIQIGIKDVPSGLELQDILYSDELFIRNYNDEWVPCVLEDNSFTFENEDKDVILRIVVNKM